MECDYFLTYESTKVNYCLGGDYNLLNMARYSKDEEKKYIPYQNGVVLPHNITINDHQYQESNGYCGTVLLEVNTYYDFEKSLLTYEELNYRANSIDEEEFIHFKKQGKIKYNLGETTHVIDSNSTSEFSQVIDNTEHLIFVDIN